MNELPHVEGAPDREHETSVPLRYEDVAQDGRLRLAATQVCVGRTVWQGSLLAHPIMERMRKEQIVPILRRFVATGGDAPISVHRPVTASGRWALAELRDGDRFLLEMRVDVSAPRGDTFGRPVSRAGEVDDVASVYGEHVLTRLFAPPGQRRVTSLPEGVSAAATRDWVPQEALLAIDDALPERTERVVRFGLTHTDSNQHVNSLVYIQVLEELSIEAWGDGRQLVRDVDVAWRKPCFADEQVTFAVRRVERDGRRGVVATVEAEGEAEPRCCAQLWLG